MTQFDDLLDELKQKRDELRLQIHLASKDAKDEWEELEGKMKDFAAKADLERIFQSRLTKQASLIEELCPWGPESPIEELPSAELQRRAREGAATAWIELGMRARREGDEAETLRCMEQAAKAGLARGTLLHG